MMQELKKTRGEQIVQDFYHYLHLPPANIPRYCCGPGPRCILCRDVLSCLKLSGSMVHWGYRSQLSGRQEVPVWSLEPGSMAPTSWERIGHQAAWRMSVTPIPIRAITTPTSLLLSNHHQSIAYSYPRTAYPYVSVCTHRLSCTVLLKIIGCKCL